MVIQKFIQEVYKSNFSLIFLCIFYIYFLIIKINKRQQTISLIIIITILFYLFGLSFIKAAQRYIILAIPFIFLIILNNRQPKIIIYCTLILYFFVNSFLLANYYIVGKSSEIILKYLKTNQILEHTIPNVITPHVYHLYDSPKMINNNKIRLKSSDYIINYYDPNALFSSKINFFGYEIKKFSVIKHKK